MNIKVIKQKEITRVIINEPKTYNSLSFDTLVTSAINNPYVGLISTLLVPVGA